MSSDSEGYTLKSPTKIERKWCF